MIITHIKGGIGNQLWQYAAGRRLAHKLNTELKLDTTFYDHDNLRPYALNLFNITAPLATPEEINRVKMMWGGGIKAEKDYHDFIPEALNYPDNVWLDGYWQHEEYFADIADILREEFTLKYPLGEAALRWKEKILSVECSVSFHVRNGDFIYSPINSANSDTFAILPLDYYYDCLKLLKQTYKNITVFVFSDNLNWCKENFNVDVPIKFVDDCESDIEELYLMSLCKHNVISKSTFSWWGAWLNQNPDKKVFRPPLATDTAKNIPNENSPLDSDKWIRMPVDFSKRPNITMRPYFSLLLVVNDDASTIGETLGSIFGQDYKWYEVIIIDNASTDGSGKICRQAVQTRDNVTLIKLWNRIPNGTAWNKALDLAQGDFVLFLRGNDRMLANALSSMYSVNEHSRVDVVNSTVWLNESDSIDMSGRKFVAETAAAFRGLNRILRDKFDKTTLLKIFATDGGTSPLGTKIFKREFLIDNQIRFNEKKDAELQFVMDAMFRAEENIFVPNVFYVTPRK